jgi:putative transposase
MTRPLRLHYAGESYHVMSRGNERRPIVRDDEDRTKFIALLGKAVERFHWILLAYALMLNHFHLFLQLTEDSLSAGVQWLNGEYVKYFNRKHKRVGHLFQGPPQMPLVDTDTYFLELLRYVALNPVHHGVVDRPEDYEWTSHRALSGMCDAPSWLAVDDALIAFAPERNLAQRLYKNFVDEGIGKASYLEQLENEPYLGSDEWMKSVREKVELRPRSTDHALAVRRVGRATMTDIVDVVADALRVDPDMVRHERGGMGRMIASWLGVHEGMLKNSEIAAGLRISCSSVSRLLEKCESQLRGEPALQRCVDECISTLRGVNAKQ